jgi:hypothetical protein
VQVAHQREQRAFRIGLAGEIVEYVDLLALLDEFGLGPLHPAGREAAPGYVGLGHDEHPPRLAPGPARHRPAEDEVVTGDLRPLVQQDRLGRHTLAPGDVGKDAGLSLVPPGVEQAATMGDAA